ARHMESGRNRLSVESDLYRPRARACAQCKRSEGRDRTQSLLLDNEKCSVTDITRNRDSDGHKGLSAIREARRVYNCAREERRRANLARERRCQVQVARP